MVDGSALFQFPPSSFAQPQNNVSSMSQFQPQSQMQAPVVPVGGQPWLSSGGQSAAVVAPVQQPGQQPSSAPSADAVSALFTSFFLFDTL